MSAFVVPKVHIDLIVDVAMWGPRAGANRGWRGEHRSADPNELGRLLWVENVKSCEYRYEDSQKVDYSDDRNEAEEYTFAQPGYRLTLSEALEAIACLEYQSCEHPTWEDSQAHEALHKLREALIDQVRDHSVWCWTEDKLDERVKEAKEHAADIKLRILTQLKGGHNEA